MRIVGILLVLVGIVGVAYGGLSWTRPKTVIDAGPIKVQSEKRETLPIPPIAGVICVVAGIVLLARPQR